MACKARIKNVDGVVFSIFFLLLIGQQGSEASSATKPCWKDLKLIELFCAPTQWKMTRIISPSRYYTPAASQSNFITGQLNIISDYHG
jgi:hypothetical protein